MQGIFFYEDLNSTQTRTRSNSFTHTDHMWHDMVYQGQSRHFSQNWAIDTVIKHSIFPPYSETKLWILVLFMYFFVFYWLDLNFTFADFGLNGPYHVTQYSLSLPNSFVWLHKLHQDTLQFLRLNRSWARLDQPNRLISHSYRK